MLKDKVHWIFFDVGTTLVDETEAYNHRIRNTIAGTDISFEQFQEKHLKGLSNSNLGGLVEKDELPLEAVEQKR